MVEIKITIPNEKLDDLKEGFLKAVTRPPQYEYMTDIQFFKQWLKDSILNAYKTGKIEIAKETTTPSIDEDVVTSVD